MVKKLFKTDQAYVKQSVCDKNRRFVCCPIACKTSDEKDGICRPLTTCTAVKSMLEAKPVPPKIKNYVLMNLKICGFGDDRNKTRLVCCNDESSVTIKLPEPPFCGTDYTDNIVGGNETKIDDFPWTALLFYNITRRGTQYVDSLCGGSLINSRYVLTGKFINFDFRLFLKLILLFVAAHCVILAGDRNLAFARLGEWDTSTDIDIDDSYVDGPLQAEMHVDVAIEKEIVHDDYDHSAKKNDIAVLRLARKVVYSHFIKPICLPMQPSQRNANLAGVLLIVAGLTNTNIFNLFNFLMLSLFKDGAKLNQQNQATES